jgi:solute carrier family 35 protein E1
VPWTAATWELFFGFPYVFILWTSGLRKTPKLSWKSIKLLAPSGILLAGTRALPTCMAPLTMATLYYGYAYCGCTHYGYTHHGYTHYGYTHYGTLLTGTHVGGVISFGLGAISFTHVLKATEPVWSALISAVVFRDFLPLPVYPSLAPTILSCAPFLAASSPYLGPYLSPNPNPTRTLTLLEP